MLERPAHKPALADKATIEGIGIRLEPLPEGHLLHVVGEFDADTLANAISASGLATTTVRAAGYKQWYLTGEEIPPPSRIAVLGNFLQGRGFLSDQSHGRIRMALSGPRATDLLARGTAIDLHANEFAVGRSAVTLFGHVSVQLTRTGTTRFELTVLRSFAEDLYEALEHAVAFL